MIAISTKGVYTVLAVLMILHLGAIRKNEDPIQKTQTDPITYKKKMEEIKDGVKGAPAPSFKYYGKEEFLIKTAVGTAGEQAAEAVPSPVADVSEVQWEEDFPEDDLQGAEFAAEESGGEAEEEWWAEEENLEKSQESTDLETGHR